MRNVVVPLAAALVAVSLGACHSSSSDQTPSPTASPIAIVQGSLVVPGHGFLPVSMTTTTAGTLTLRLGLTSNIVVAGIVSSACAAGARNGCAPLSYSEAVSSDSSKTLTAPGAAAGSYVVVFGNVGAASQSVTYAVTLTTS